MRSASVNVPVVMTSPAPKDGWGPRGQLAQRLWLAIQTENSASARRSAQCVFNSTHDAEW